MENLVPIVLQVSLALIVIALGLTARVRDVIALWRRPALLARSLLALNLVVPALVLLVVLALEPIRPVKVALVLLAISPIPPILPQKQLKLSSDRFYIDGLLVISSLIAVIYVPVAVKLLGALLGQSFNMPAGGVFRIVLVSLIAPLTVGMLTRQYAPTLAERVQPLIHKAGTALMLFALAFILVRAWRPLLALIGNGTVLIIALVVLLALVTGHVLGGPKPADRGVLALAATAHHPAVAIAVGAAVFPGDRSIGSAVLLYLLLSGILTGPYMKWWKRHQQARVKSAKNAAMPITTSKTAA